VVVVVVLLVNQVQTVVQEADKVVLVVLSVMEHQDKVIMAESVTQTVLRETVAEVVAPVALVQALVAAIQVTEAQEQGGGMAPPTQVAVVGLLTTIILRPSVVQAVVVTVTEVYGMVAQYHGEVTEELTLAEEAVLVQAVDMMDVLVVQAL
jgi:hypothetical protein